MSYFDTGFSATRGTFDTYGDEYNRMKMQAEMNAEATADALQKLIDRERAEAHYVPNPDTKYIAHSLAAGLRQAFAELRYGNNAKHADKLNQYRAETVEANRARNNAILERVLANPKAMPANIPHSYADACRIRDYTVKHNRYPAPWHHPRLWEDYKELVDAYLRNAPEKYLLSGAERCVNAWRAELKLLRIRNAHQECASAQEVSEMTTLSTR